MNFCNIVYKELVSACWVKRPEFLALRNGYTISLLYNPIANGIR